MDADRATIERWLLLDGCRLPPRVFAIIDDLLAVTDRQEWMLTHYRAALQSDLVSEHDLDET